ncbi:hypothetical protein [Aurantiacibacter gilvus]|uniref:Lipoprotein n=1 Tax=Aurantiacibacter gilvus TaxID=3139141 RepID=A0ABU9IC13_9SPHN
MSPRLLGATLAAVASLGLGACTTYDDYGYPTSRVSVGIGYGAPYYGWYDGFYYPGTGYYIYDRRGTRHRWSHRYRDYWLARRPRDHRYYDNWGGYNAPHRYSGQPRYRDQRRAYRDDRREDRYDRDRRQARDDRRDQRGDARRDRREDRYDRDRRRTRDDRRARSRDDRGTRRDRRDRRERGDRRRDRQPDAVE